MRTLSLISLLFVTAAFTPGCATKAGTGAAIGAGAGAVGGYLIGKNNGGGGKGAAIGAAVGAGAGYMIGNEQDKADDRDKRDNSSGN